MIYFIGPKELLPTEEFQYANPKQCLEYFAGHEEIEVDLETTGLDSRKDKIIALQIGDRENQYVIDARHIDILQFKQNMYWPQYKI
jgi:ribonuclease D